MWAAELFFNVFSVWFWFAVIGLRVMLLLGAILYPFQALLGWIERGYGIRLRRPPRTIPLGLGKKYDERIVSGLMWIARGFGYVLPWCVLSLISF